MAEFNNIDEFLNHRGSESTGAKRLKSWAKNPGYLNFWFHTKVLPTSVWYHRFPELVVRPDKNDQTKTHRNIWGRSHVCWEDESILKKQRFRTPEGRREHPPTKCGSCRLTEAVRELIVAGHLKDTDILFEFKGADDPKENTIIHAGGLCSIWRRDTSDEDKERLKKHGIFLSDAWKENHVAKLNYIFVGVNQDDVAAGLQVAVQTQDVGDKVKRCINNEIASNDGDKGNPFLNPYCVRVLYKAEEKEFGKRYDALRMNKYALTSEIERLIRGERPNLARYVEKFNQKTMLSLMQEHATAIGKQLPWKDIFDVPLLEPKEAPAPTTASRVPEVSTKPPEPPAGTIPCDDCQNPMRPDETKCSKCGATYEVDAAAAAQGAPAPPPNPAASPVAEPEGVYEDQDVPF